MRGVPPGHQANDSRLHFALKVEVRLCLVLEGTEKTSRYRASGKSDVLLATGKGDVVDPWFIGSTRLPVEYVDGYPRFRHHAARPVCRRVHDRMDGRSFFVMASSTYLVVTMSFFNPVLHEMDERSAIESPPSPLWLTTLAL